MAGSLFERLTQGEIGMKMDEDESIRNHILRMFTARQGSVLAIPDFGLPDLNDLTLSQAELVIENCKAMKACIEKYEPRLVDVKVESQKLDGAHFTQGFKITAHKYNENGQLSPWSLSVSLDADRIRKRA